MVSHPTQGANRMFNREGRIAKLEASAESRTPKALQMLRARRAHIVTLMSSNVTVTAVTNDEILKLAQELFYVDHAIESLMVDDPDDS
jgi:hypothetical protein